jgi:hypothetical protein
MILGFSKFNESILLDPGNWGKDLISKLDFDEDYIKDICQDIIDSGASITIERKIFNDSFDPLSNKNDIDIQNWNRKYIKGDESMPTGWKNQNWYQGYKLTISTGAKNLYRFGWTDKYSVDEIINVFPSIIETLNRMNAEFQVVVIKFDMSFITLLLLDRSKKLDPKEIKFLPSKNQLKSDYVMTFPDTDKIARRISQATGGENSIFKATRMYPNVGTKDNTVVVELTNPNFDREKGKEILTKIVSSLIRKINLASGKSYEFAIQDTGNYWSVSFN